MGFQEHDKNLSTQEYHTGVKQSRIPIGPDVLSGLI